MKWLLLYILTVFSTYAEDRLTSTPLRDIEEVHSSTKTEKVLRLSNARVAIVDYELLRLDFSELQKLSNEQIDEWLLSQTAYISEFQAGQTDVNSKIPSNGHLRSAERPPKYGRAVVYRIKSPFDDSQIGLIDAKGAGADFVPHHGTYGNGLATLGECIREYNYENAIREVLAEAGSGTKTVGSYAVIDAGFDVIHEDGSRSRAGIYLRQAHSRPSEYGNLNDYKTAKFQELFHRYGIDPHWNIQGTVNGDIYDFGHYVVKDDLPSIDPQKQFPFSQWGYDKSIPVPVDADDKTKAFYYSKFDRPWIWAHQTADAFANGTADRDAIWKHHRDMVEPIIEKLHSCNSLLRATR